MSYDIYLKQGDDRVDADLPDPTYNLTPIFHVALEFEEMPNPDVTEAQVVLFRAETDKPRGLRVLSGRVAGDTVEQLRMALERLRDPAMDKVFRNLEPSNKWGVKEDAIKVIGWLIDAAVEFPGCTWEVH